MSWAKVLSGVTRLAELLIDEGDWAGARFLADLAQESGEAKLAEHIGSLSNNAWNARLAAQLAAIRPHERMTASELRDVVTGFRALKPYWRYTEADEAIKDARKYMTGSALAIAQQKNNKPAMEIAEKLCAEQSFQVSLPRLFNGILTILELCGEVAENG